MLFCIRRVMFLMNINDLVEISVRLLLLWKVISISLAKNTADPPPNFPSPCYSWASNKNQSTVAITYKGISRQQRGNAWTASVVPRERHLSDGTMDQKRFVILCFGANDQILNCTIVLIWKINPTCLPELQKNLSVFLKEQGLDTEQVHRSDSCDAS